MNHKLSNVSMLGRMAYTIMCVEKYLKTMHPYKDWSLLASAMWKATSTNWGEWPEYYSSFIPDVLLNYKKFNEELSISFSENDYQKLLDTYSNITNGNEDDPSDEVNYMINLPFEMSMIYEGTPIGNGEESFKIIDEAEKILIKHDIPLPDYHKVLFSSINEKNGWGKPFCGTYLSIII